ncbi:YajQ family cyclic di-GMP-binding protein [soil metagenome]
MPSFDIVSKVPWNEVDNALNQAQKELSQRFDFKGTDTEVEKTDDGIEVRSSSDDRVKAALEVVQEKLIKRKVSLKFFEQGKVEKTGKGGAKILLEVKEGIEGDQARELVKLIKDSKIRVQSAMQDAQVRVTGKNRDDLQAAIQLVRSAGLSFETQFLNFRD